MNRPRYTAWSGASYIESADSMPELLATVRKLAEGTGEDVGFWCENRLVGVLLFNGVFVSFEGVADRPWRRRRTKPTEAV